MKRDKCQRTLGEIKQQLACTHPGKRKSATVRESCGLWSKPAHRHAAERKNPYPNSKIEGKRFDQYAPIIYNNSIV